MARSHRREKEWGHWIYPSNAVPRPRTIQPHSHHSPSEWRSWYSICGGREGGRERWEDDLCSKVLHFHLFSFFTLFFISVAFFNLSFHLFFTIFFSISISSSLHHNASPFYILISLYHPFFLKSLLTWFSSVFIIVHLVYFSFISFNRFPSLV